VSSDRLRDVQAAVLASLGVDGGSPVRVVGGGSLPSVFRVSDLAASCVAAAGICLNRLIVAVHGSGSGVIEVDRDLASHWFGISIRPIGWELPRAWDAIGGDYEASDGWVRLHTNASHHRAAALRVLDVGEDKDDVTAAVRRWTAHELAEAVMQAGGVAAAMLSIADWRRHPQGRSVQAEPVVSHEQTGRALAPLELSGPARGRPLAGVRVLDLTRVLAGPVATRLLAGWGANVLRIDPPEWDEPAVIPEIMLGKRSARLDLTVADDRNRFTELLSRADVLVHGYRPGALDGLGFDQRARDEIRPGLVDVALNAYGWTGPWTQRRGFDSLVQMNSGIAEHAMRACGSARPKPLPVQAIDHATGYLMGASAITGITARYETGRGSRWRLSLARTAQLLIDAGQQDPKHATKLNEPALTTEIEETAWGPARRIRPPITIDEAPLNWDRPARPLGADTATW